MSKFRVIPCVAAALFVSACGGNDTVASDGVKASADAGNSAMAAAATGTESVLKAVPSGKYVLDSGHAYIAFEYSHFGFSNPTLRFNEFDVELMLDSENIENSTLSVTIDANSIDSGVAKLDKHLVSDDMFDTANYPTITFNATDFVVTSADTLEVTGDLTIKSTTRPVILNTKINKAANHPRRKVPIIGISASTMIKRSEFDVSYAVPNVGDDVSIRISLEMPKAK